MTKLTFVPITEDLYLWATKFSGDSQRKRGIYELGWEPWGHVEGVGETFSVYRRIGASCAISREAITLKEFLTLPPIMIPPARVETDRELENTHYQP
jgi:hypothetical protein